MKYKSIVVNSYLDADEAINKQAEEGWQLVTALSFQGSLLFYFKQ